MSRVKGFSSLEEVIKIADDRPSKEGRDSHWWENQGTVLQMIALVLGAVRLYVELAG